MFIAVFNWMLAHVPGFFRPGVVWLIDGLRRLTSYVSSRWNAMGRAFGRVYGSIAGLRAHMGNFVVTVYFLGVYLISVYIPRKVTDVVSKAVAVVMYWVDLARNEAKALYAIVIGWTQARIAEIRVKFSDLIRWATSELSDLRNGLAQLLRALGHVLAGPDALAEWMLGGLLRVAARYALGARDRIFNWVLRDSVVFTQWVARLLEDMIVRNM